MAKAKGRSFGGWKHAAPRQGRLVLVPAKDKASDVHRYGSKALNQRSIAETSTCELLIASIADFKRMILSRGCYSCPAFTPSPLPPQRARANTAAFSRQNGGETSRGIRCQPSFLFSASIAPKMFALSCRRGEGVRATLRMPQSLQRKPNAPLGFQSRAGKMTKTHLSNSPAQKLDICSSLTLPSCYHNSWRRDEPEDRLIGTPLTESEPKSAVAGPAKLAA